MNSPLTIPVKNALSHIVVVGNGMVGATPRRAISAEKRAFGAPNYRDWCRALYRV